MLALPPIVASTLAQAPTMRPRVEGAAHIACYVSDLTKARAYYEMNSPQDEIHVAHAWRKLPS